MKKVPGYSYGALQRIMHSRWGGIDWLSEMSGQRSSGVIDACHLPPKDVLSRRFPYGARWDAHRRLWIPLVRNEIPAEDIETRTLGKILMDVRFVVPGSRDLHAAWDNKRLVDANGRQLIRRDMLPAPMVKAIAEHGMTWWLDEYYEIRQAVSA